MSEQLIEERFSRGLQPPIDISDWSVSRDPKLKFIIYSQITPRKLIRAKPKSVKVRVVGNRISTTTPHKGSESWVSPETTKFVAKEIRRVNPGECNGEEQTLVERASTLVQKTTLDLIHTLAQSLRLLKDDEPYRIAVRGRFTEPVARALLARLPVDLYEQVPFVDALCRDFLEAASGSQFRSHRKWRIDVDLDGTASLTVLESNRKSQPVPPPEAHWERASAIKISDLAR